METEIRRILSTIYPGQKENNDQAVEQLLPLFKKEITIKEFLQLFKEWQDKNGDDITSIEIFADGSGEIVDIDYKALIEWNNIEEGVRLLKEGRTKERFD